MAIGVRVEGLDALQEMLRVTLPNEAHNLTREAIFKVAKSVAAEIKQSAPVRTGNLRLSIKAVRLKGNRTTVASDVRFTTGPLVNHDGFYWRFVEHGTAPHSTASGANRSANGRGRGWRKGGGKVTPGASGGQHTPARPFVQPVITRLEPQIPAILRKEVGIALEKNLARKAKRAKP